MTKTAGSGLLFALVLVVAGCNRSGPEPWGSSTAETGLAAPDAQPPAADPQPDQPVVEEANLPNPFIEETPPAEGPAEEADSAASAEEFSPP